MKFPRLTRNLNATLLDQFRSARSKGLFASRRRIAVILLGSSLITSGLALLPTMSASAGAPVNAVAWTQVAIDPIGCGGTTACTTAPTNLSYGSSMAYDPATQQMVLYGNSGGTWTWSGTAWTQVDGPGTPGCTTTCTNTAGGRNTFALAYDPESQALILFGSNQRNDTWAWNGTTWTQVADAASPGCTDSCLNSPPRTVGTQMAYDDATHQMVLFGGAEPSYGPTNYNDTWVLSYSAGTYTWAQVADSVSPGCLGDCPNSPPGRNVSKMAYDPATQQLVLWGGEVTGGDANGTNATWIWTGTQWQQVDDGNGANAGCGSTYPVSNPCPTSPPGRVGEAMTYDPALRELIIFGGMNRFNAQEYNDTWAWNGTIWTQVDNAGNPTCGDGAAGNSCTDSPPMRDIAAMADDPATNQIVLFGGNGYGSGSCGCGYTDTWVADATPVATRVSGTVYFASGSTSLTVSAKHTLNTLATQIVSQSQSSVTLNGYTDPRGAASTNLRLSTQRANSVKSYLKSKLISLGDTHVTFVVHGRGVTRSGSSYAHDRKVTLS